MVDLLLYPQVRSRLYEAIQDDEREFIPTEDLVPVFERVCPQKVPWRAAPVGQTLATALHIRPRRYRLNKKPVRGFFRNDLLEALKPDQTSSRRASKEKSSQHDPELPVRGEDIAVNKISKMREDYYRKLWNESQTEMSRLATLVSLYAHLEDPRPDPPSFLLPPKTQKTALNENRVVFCSILSDTHFSEVVLPAHVNGVNAYNREIAKKRLHRYFEKIEAITKNYIAGVKLDGLVVALGGDMLSGIIHEELRETNESHMLEEAVYWAGEIASGLKHLSESMKVPVYVPCVVGNHGRMTKKPVYKYRAEDNLDYLLYLLCARFVESVPEITFDIAKSSELSFRVYDTTYILCHGDEFRGGKGISGIYTPIALGRMRKQERELSLRQSYDILLMGHFHQLLYGGNFIINGSLIGANEYSYMQSMRVEPPQQAFWLNAPRGITLFGPIFVDDVNSCQPRDVPKVVAHRQG